MFHYFTIKFHFSFFASFRLTFFASLHFGHFCFEVKQSEAKFKSIFSLFFTFLDFFSLFFTFFRFFSIILAFFALNFSLRFDLVIFASKENKAKRNSSLFFSFFRFFSLFFAFFHSIFVSLRFFRLIFAYLPLFSRQIFGVSHRSELCEIRFFFASKGNEIFASISNFASEAKVRAHPNTDLSSSDQIYLHPLCWTKCCCSG